MEPRFLEVQEVIALHAGALRHDGGLPGIRDRGALDSAVWAPRQDFFYDSVELPAIAAAYLFHIVAAHAFVDGNKRAGLASALAFLGANDLRWAGGPDNLESITLDVAAGRTDKAAAVAQFHLFCEEI
jgi:death-on-curing protein